uniref:DUF5071 domain-containing protein n=1 Tax=Mycena chlorophos TaxID=658473 RepID=A0ABQ0LCJ1_MYCCL|nr:predicted protein [Mycena chlorophos]
MTESAKADLQRLLRSYNAEREEQLLELSDADLGHALPTLLNAVWAMQDSTRKSFARRLYDALGPLKSSEVTNAVNALLMTPSQTDEAAHLLIMFFGWDGIILSLPKSRLAALRPGLDRLVNHSTATERWWRDLVPQASLAVHSIDSTGPWTPTSSHDWLALRSLDTVTTPEEMRPFVEDLLEWLRLPSCPVYKGCVAQLARFPELCVAPIRERLSWHWQQQDPAGWMYWVHHLLLFVKHNVPTNLWRELRGELKRIVQSSTEDHRPLRVIALQLLQQLDGYEARPSCRKIL